MSPARSAIAPPSEAELIEMERDIDWLDGEYSTISEDEDEYASTVTMSLPRAERIVNAARRLIDLARERGAR